MALDHSHNGTVLPHKRLDLKHQFRNPGWHKPITSNISISLSLSSCVACGWVDKLGWPWLAAPGGLMCADSINVRRCWHVTSYVHVVGCLQITHFMTANVPASFQSASSYSKPAPSPTCQPASQHQNNKSKNTGST